jgi:hypothetical protein
MQSTVLITCDDDILPGPTYISGFLKKYEAYGHNDVLCSRGHLFRNHQLDEENPDLFWSKEETKLKIFYDESHPDCEVKQIFFRNVTEFMKFTMSVVGSLFSRSM